MQILKLKKKTTDNYLDLYQYYLKNFNFFNKFKKKNKTLLKDILILRLKEYYLININLKENIFIFDEHYLKKKKKELKLKKTYGKYYYNRFLKNRKIDLYKKINTLKKKTSLNILNNKIHFIYRIEYNNNKGEILINYLNLNYFLLNLYTYLLFKKKNIYIVKNLFIKNLKKKFIYKKKIYLFSYLKGNIIRIKYNKKYSKKNNNKKFLISFYSLIKKYNKKYIYNLKNQNKIKDNQNRFKNNFYFRRKQAFKKIFKYYKHNFLFFKMKNFKINYSRKSYVYDFKKNQCRFDNNLKFKNFYKLYYINNFN